MNVSKWLARLDRADAMRDWEIVREIRNEMNDAIVSGEDIGLEGDLKIDPSVLQLLMWRDRATDRYGDDLVSLLMNEFGSDPYSHSGRTIRNVPPEHETGLKIFRNLSYDDQYKTVENFVGKESGG